METNDSKDRLVHRQKGRGRKAFWIALAALAVVVVLAVDGRPRQRGALTFTDGWNDRAERAFEYLGLSAEQQSTITPVLAQMELSGTQLAAEHARIVADFEAVLRSAETDAAQVEALRSDLRQLADNAIDAGISALTETWPVLSPEQRADVLDHWQRRR